MTPEDAEPLSSLAKSLLDLERTREGPSPAQDQRVFDLLVRANALPAHATATAAVATRAVTMKVLLGVTVGALVGGSSVATWYARQFEAMRAELAEFRTDALLKADQPVANPQSAPQPVAPPPPPARPPASARVVKLPEPAPPPVRGAGSLSEEATIIDQARTALLKGNFDGAATALALHETRFASGGMTEEREVMAIQVLLGQRRDADARVAADRFHRLHPSSLLGPTVDSLFETAP